MSSLSENQLQEYKETLESLFRFDQPEMLSNLMHTLSAHDSARIESLAHLTKAHIISILQRYILSQLTAIEVENWANAVEMRDDIEFGDDNDDLTLDAIGELANPLLTEALTPKSAQVLIEKLKA